MVDPIAAPAVFAAQTVQGLCTPSIIDDRHLILCDEHWAVGLRWVYHAEHPAPIWVAGERAPYAIYDEADDAIIESLVRIDAALDGALFFGFCLAGQVSIARDIRSFATRRKAPQGNRPSAAP